MRVECRDLVGGRRGPINNETFNKINQYLPRAVAEQRAQEGLIGGQMPGRGGSAASRDAESSQQAAAGSSAAAATTTTTTITETTNLRWIADAPTLRNLDERARNAEKEKRDKEEKERRENRGKRKAEREERENFMAERKKFEEEKAKWEREKRGREENSSGRGRDRRSKSPRRRSKSPGRRSRSPRRRSRSPKRNNEVRNRLPSFFQECLTRADQLRDTSADLLEYVGHSSEAYRLKRKIQNVGQMPQGNSRKVDNRQVNNKKGRPAGRQQQPQQQQHPVSTAPNFVVPPNPSFSSVVISATMPAPIPVSPSASVPVVFAVDAAQPSFASLAAVQGHPLPTQVHPPLTSAYSDLQGRETERSRSWRRGCEERNVVESAAGSSSEVIENTPEALNINPDPVVSTPVNPAPVAEALAVLVIEENESPEKNGNADKKEENAEDADEEYEDADGKDGESDEE